MINLSDEQQGMLEHMLMFHGTAYVMLSRHGSVADATILHPAMVTVRTPRPQPEHRTMTSRGFNEYISLQLAAGNRMFIESAGTGEFKVVYIETNYTVYVTVTP